MHYITAITKPQIEALLKAGTLQMELFEQALAEVEAASARYILRRNPRRAAKMAATRQDKLASLRQTVDAKNAWLAADPCAVVKLARLAVEKHIEKPKLACWISVRATERRLEIVIDQAAREEATKLDGCYVIKTDLPAAQADKVLIHARYKDLARVERAFRTKTVELEMRPIHVRREDSTRGHVLVVMLAYRLAQKLARRWNSVDLTAQEAINELSTLCAQRVFIDGVERCCTVPASGSCRLAQLFELAGVTPPAAFAARESKQPREKTCQSNAQHAERQRVKRDFSPLLRVEHPLNIASSNLSRRLLKNRI